MTNETDTANPIPSLEDWQHWTYVMGRAQQMLMEAWAEGLTEGEGWLRSRCSTRSRLPAAIRLDSDGRSRGNDEGRSGSLGEGAGDLEQDDRPRHRGEGECQGSPLRRAGGEGEPGLRHHPQDVSGAIGQTSRDGSGGRG